MAAVLASVAFYLPSILLQIVFGSDWTVFLLLPLTIGLPLLVSCLFQCFRRFADTRSWPTAFAMMLGIWVLGPVWLGMLAALDGAGKAALPGLHEMLLFPIYTFIESTYDGLLFALQFTTILLISRGAGWGPFRSVAVKRGHFPRRSGTPNEH